MQVKEESKRGIAFFDLDLTITDVDTFRKFLIAYYLDSPKKLHYALYVFLFGVLRKLRIISLRAFKQGALIGLKGLKKHDVHTLGKALFDQDLSHSIRKKAFDHILQHKKNGDVVYIITASPDIYVKAFCDHLNCDGYYCTKLTYENDSCTGRISGNDCMGGEKQRYIIEVLSQYNIQREDAFAYSDHEADLPMLECVGNPCVISPTLILKLIAEDRRWPVRYW